MSVRPRTPRGLKPKDLIGLPWRLAFALQDDGWWVRSEVIWHKPNAHPESVADRPTKAHETVFLLSKDQRLLLRRQRRPRGQRPALENGLGHSDQPAPPRSDIPTTITPRRCRSTWPIAASRSRANQVTWCWSPYAGSGHHPARGGATATAVGRYRAQGGVRAPDRTSHEQMNDRDVLKARIDTLSPMAVRFVARLVDSLSEAPTPNAVTPTWLTRHPDWIEYFGLAISAHHGTTTEPLGLTSFETVFSQRVRSPIARRVVSSRPATDRSPRGWRSSTPRSRRLWPARRRGGGSGDRRTRVVAGSPSSASSRTCAAS